MLIDGGRHAQTQGDDLERENQRQARPEPSISDAGRGKVELHDGDNFA
jgi:hypothetical protein